MVYEINIFVPFDEFFHFFPGGFCLSASKARFFRSRFLLSRTSVWKKDQRRLGMAFEDAPDKPFQPLFDLPGRRIRKKIVEYKGVSLGFRSDVCEECAKFALSAGTEVDDPEYHGATQPCGVGHSRTAYRDAVRDT